APALQDGSEVTQGPQWTKTWASTPLLTWMNKNQDRRIQYRAGHAFTGAPAFKVDAAGCPERGPSGAWLVTNQPTTTENELYIDRDILGLANPEIAQLPDWIVALVAAGAHAAALSTAAGLLLVVSTAVSHDLIKRVISPGITEKNELLAARIA